MRSDARTRTVVVALGSPIQADDAVGLVALARLRDGASLDANVELWDGGTSGLELLPVVESAERLLVLDAIRSGAPPGTLVALEGAELPRLFSTKLSPHQIDLREVLALAELRGRLPREIVALGVEPERIETSVALSVSVERTLPALVARARERLAAWGHDVRPREGAQLVVRGVVQGVGFRPWIARRARALGLSGRVRNEPDCVRIEAFGAADALAALERAVRECDLPAAEVREVERSPLAPRAGDGFEIAPGPTEGAAPASARLSLAPDLAVCDACADDVADPLARHHRYAFTSCALCGPRFSIARSLPWERARSSMAELALCADCARDREAPESQRFGAEALACPSCGPQLVLVDPAGAALASGERALERAAAAIRAGGIVAVQGIGGFHLACNATSEAAVAELRLRKRRERKPFAVMAADRAQALAIAALSDDELALLGSPERPIVLATRRAEARLAPSVAPGSPRVGLLLPYTPLHILLLAACGRPLVMTSGNRAGEPIAHEAVDARERLAKVADVFLAHDRAIEGPCDDSVAAVIAGEPVLFRRSRGFVPRPIMLRRAARAPVLACGAQLQSAFCLVAGDRAVLSAHHGDLDDEAALDAYELGVARLEALLGVRPEVIAHDLHPLYGSTRYAVARAAAHSSIRTVGVQHHHAHVASVLAEHGLEGPVIGVAYDGTGLGADGGDGAHAAWGGEILCATARRFERIATFRPIALAGGDAAVREPWRAAVAVLEDAYDGAPPLDRIPLFERVAPARVDAVRRLVRSGMACTPAHGVGRWFDALGSLVLALPVADFSGEVALAWNHAAQSADAPPYPFELSRAREPWELDLRPLVRHAVDDLIAGRSASWISARFHAALVAATAKLVSAAAVRCGALPVVLTGGCFQNALLTEGVMRRLARNHAVYVNRRVPPGDGGIALGQALVAVERMALGEIH